MFSKTVKLLTVAFPTHRDILSCLNTAYNEFLRTDYPMRSASLLHRLAIISVALGTIGPLRANWGGEAGGSVATGTFRAVGTAQVEMLEEHLIIRLYRDRAKVEVDYVLHNAGAAVDVKAGFPSLGFVVEGEEHREVEEYAILVNGQALAYRREKGNAAPYKTIYRDEFLAMVPGSADDIESCMLLEWLVSTVHFSADEKKRIHISYESLYAHSNGGLSDDTDYNDDRFHYLLSTAAAWKGPIRKGRVTIQAMTVEASKLIISPTGRFQKTPAGLVWTFRDLKPSAQDDIEINLNDRFSQIFDYANRSSEMEDGRFYVSQEGRYYLDSHDYVVHTSTDQREYPVGNVRDYDRRTEWRTRTSPGLGESIVLEMKPPAHISQIGIVPGCATDKAEWFGHSRIRELEVLVNGKYSLTAHLHDEYISFLPNSIKGFQVIDLPAYPGDATAVQLTIRSAYPGSKDQVTCVSEILLRQRLVSKPKVVGVNGKELP